MVILGLYMFNGIIAPHVPPTVAPATTIPTLNGVPKPVVNKLKAIATGDDIAVPITVIG